MTKAKRMLSLLLAVIMILSVIPITASAVEHDSDPSDGPSTGVNGLYMNKTVNSAHNELTLEAFVTGRSQTQVTQAARPEPSADPDITVPEGYRLVWNEEFNKGTQPDLDQWYYETGGNGWGNNELQHYVAGNQGNEQLAAIKDGILSIIAKKIGETVYSIRMNTKESWKYGYFEARLKLPKGKGTWPAFWMMPKNYTAWPDDGEIDIMEVNGFNVHPGSAKDTMVNALNVAWELHQMLPAADRPEHTEGLPK